MRCYMWRNGNLTHVNVKSSASHIAITSADMFFCIAEASIHLKIWGAQLPLESPSLPPLPLPYPPFISDPIPIPSPLPPFFPLPGVPTPEPAWGLGERCKLLQWGLGRSPSRQTICCISGPKGAALLATVFVDFHNNRLTFCTNIRLQILYFGAFYGDNRHYNTEQHTYKILSCSKYFF